MTANEEKLNASIQYIKSVGPKRAALFEAAGIRRIRDLLFCFPSRHLDRSTLVDSNQAFQYLTQGYEGEITIIGKVVSADTKYFHGKSILTVAFRDSAGFFQCVWFQGARYFENRFHQGDTFAISAKPTISKYGDLQFTHPDFDPISEDESQIFFSTGKIIPFYRIPKELRLKNIGDLSFRKIVTFAVEGYLSFVEETLPAHLLEQHKLMPLQSAIRAMHYPESKEQYEAAKRRFKFEELFYIELIVALRKYNLREKVKSAPKKRHSELVQRFLGTLPFSLTGAQQSAMSDILHDMEKDEPMNRLLQGDVGSGKTIVALVAMLVAVDNGFQAALMAPTEILADQHHRTITALLEKLKAKHPEYRITCSLLIGGQTKSKRAAENERILAQESQIIIGTHAIFESDTAFSNLGLVVIDEQHRFGVVQRARLIRKGEMPDCLVMSATPIPRTLSMTLYGDLDVSVINEMPKNRLPIRTHLRGESRLPLIYPYLVEEAKKGCQSFVIFPLVEESEKLELKAAMQHYEELTATYLKECKVGLLHGRMKWKEKEETMLKFKAKEFDILISTTVIEVGIDIPDANIIIINDAHHFGLSQLHQLRGRVGRGSAQAHCILVAPDEIAAKSERFSKNIEFLSPALLEKFKASVRLQTMVQHLDGFRIAEMDLKLRGPGDIFGIQQSGFPEFKFADITADIDLVYLAKEEAFKIVDGDHHLAAQDNRLLRENLLQHYSQNLQYAKIA
jgi:ATP-dependent DNA helicase RecG